MQTLTGAVFQLAPPGGLFDFTAVRNLFPGITDGARKLLVQRACKSGEIIRLSPGSYILAPEYRKSEPHPFVVASMLRFPSHISLESALSYHSLIPEAVFQVSSVTTKRSRTFHTPLGVFSFYRVPALAPLAGVETLKFDERFWAPVATPLRAIADKLYLTSKVTWEENGIEFLTESLRIERADLEGLSFSRLGEILQSFKSSRVTGYLTSLKRELRR